MYSNEEKIEDLEHEIRVLRELKRIAELRENETHTNHFVQAQLATIPPEFVHYTDMPVEKLAELIERRERDLRHVRESSWRTK